MDAATIAAAIVLTMLVGMRLATVFLLVPMVAGWLGAKMRWMAERSLRAG
jgi:hypothetical protein